MASLKCADDEVEGSDLSLGVLRGGGGEEGGGGVTEGRKRKGDRKEGRGGGLTSEARVCARTLHPKEMVAIFPFEALRNTDAAYGPIVYC